MSYRKPFAQREIVKPYLDKLKKNISFLDTYDDIEVEDEFGNTNRTKYVDFYEVMETIDDLLSGEKTMTREEAIEIIKAYRERLTSSASNLLDSDIKAFDMAIEALEQEPRWIPVSERLPEKGKEVLIYIDRFPYLATYEDGEWNTDNFTVDLEYEPTAWFELPESYEPQESER